MRLLWHCCHKWGYLLKSTFKFINNFIKYVFPLFYLNIYRKTKIYTISSSKNTFSHSLCCIFWGYHFTSEESFELLILTDTGLCIPLLFHVFSVPKQIDAAILIMVQCECGYMKKCGKNWGYLHEIEEIQVVPHFRNKYNSYMQNYQRFKSVNPIPHSETTEFE